MLKHEHLIVRALVENPPNSPEFMKTWLQDLVNDIGMKILMGPYAVYSEMCGNRGLTAACIIETSHIVLHAWDEESPGVIQLDVYSCATVDRDIVLKAMEEFNPVFVDYKFLDRSNKFIRML